MIKEIKPKIEYEDVIKELDLILNDDEYVSKCDIYKLLNLHEENIRMEEKFEIMPKLSLYDFKETINHYEVYFRLRREILKRLRNNEE